jgi:hypothetical protein
MKLLLKLIYLYIIQYLTKYTAHSSFILERSQSFLNLKQKNIIENNNNNNTLFISKPNKSLFYYIYKNGNYNFHRNNNKSKNNKIQLPNIFKKELSTRIVHLLKISSIEINDFDINSSSLLFNNISEDNQEDINESSSSTNRFFIKSMICIFCIIMIVGTFVGNTLVILAVLIVKKLHTEDNANNYLIVSLAISDLFVGLLVMPFALYVEIKEGNKYVYSCSNLNH